jgi:alpha-glucosidase
VPGLRGDPVRTPVRWTEAGGFSDAEPWLPLGDEPSVAEQDRDRGSMLALYRRLLALRRGEEALALGDHALLRAADGVLANVQGERFLVALNLTAQERVLEAPAGDVVLSARGEREGAHVAGEIALAAADALVIRLTR